MHLCTIAMHRDFFFTSRKQCMVQRSATSLRFLQTCQGERIPFGLVDACELSSDLSMHDASVAMRHIKCGRTVSNERTPEHVLSRRGFVKRRAAVICDPSSDVHPPHLPSAVNLALLLRLGKRTK